ncbi:hypothetical protein uvFWCGRAMDCOMC449_025 [Freshwater phage uvFW-CGR-AMD-COM-C449]|nr:hypothetical protein uvFWCGRAMDCOMC449_025 [Freshwater phage uvFW-CGR-AMD-COM-C449]
MAPRKPKNNQPTPPSIQGVDWNGSLADYKQSTVGNVKPGGTKVVTENRGPDTGMFAGSGTPLNSSIGMQDTSRKNVTNVIKNLAIQEVGGAAIGKLVGKVVSTVRPMYYGISGSTKPELSKLTPQIGENVKSFNTNISNMFGKNQTITTPKVFSYKPEIQNVLPVTDYAQMAGQGTGSAYVVKTPAKNIMSNIVDTGKAASAMDAFAAKGLAAEQMSSKAMKVVKEFPMSNYTKRTYDTMEAAWETSQNFSPLAGQISRAIQADKKLQSSIITGMVKGVTRANTIRKK